MNNVVRALKKPLSGYLGGIRGGGYWIERLSAEWSEAFQVRYAIPCNSATSGLLAACIAVGISPGDEVWTTCYSMSATAACALHLGAEVKFMDIEIIRYGLWPIWYADHSPKAIIVTNLFGHPAYLHDIKICCDRYNIPLIEDNAQAPFAMENNQYTGTIGDIGVFSLNVHKHIQAGEGGVVVTNNEILANKIHRAINHGELDADNPLIGLNLRMTETTAAIACAQLAKAEKIIEGRRQLAYELTDMVKDIPWIKPPIEDEGCKSVYYLWTPRIIDGDRNSFVKELQDQGFPIRAGYSPLLTRVFNSDDPCPVAEKIEDEEIAVFEVCTYDPTAKELRRMREIIKAAT